MALVTIHRSPTPSNCTTAENQSCDLTDVTCDVESSIRSPHRSHSFSESYLAVKGAALILPQSECTRTVTHDSPRGDIHCHLQSMFYLLRSQDTIKVAVKLESRNSQSAHHRYMALVSTIGTQDLEESVILGIDIVDQKATIGLVFPIWSDLRIHLDGDGGYSVKSNEKKHIFKPVSVQAMWSSLQCLNKVQEVASSHRYLPDGLTHTWISFYQSQVNSDQTFMAEWHAMDGIDSHREDLVSDGKENTELEKAIRMKLREMAMTVDFEEVTSKELRTRLEDDLNQSLAEFRHFIDEEIVIIFRQMEAPSKIFDYLYLGSEWNASNLEELKNNGVGYIINVAREIDNFFPGAFKYLNIPVFDTEDADLLKYWDKTYKFIRKAKESSSKVLVHCKMGVSRSASTVVAFAMKEKNWSQDEALNYVLKQRSCVKPNRGFMKQLETYQGILDASKQRHSKLWKTMLPGSHTSTPVRDGATPEPGNESLVSGNCPLSSSVNNSLMPAQSNMNTSSSSDTASEVDAQDESYSELYMINPGSSADEPQLCSNFETGSRSESQEDLLSLNLDCHSDSADEPQDWRKVPAASVPIKLLRYTKVDRDDVRSEFVVPNEVADCDSDEVSSKDEHPCEQGSYDISMLAGYRSNSVFDNDDEDDDIFFNGESPLLHPDMVLEYMQAEQLKKRRIMKMLNRNESSACMEGYDGGDVRTGDPQEKRAKTSRRVSESSDNASVPPALTKVRPDNSWIRESSEDGSLSTEASPEEAVVGQSEADMMTHGSAPLNLTELLPSSKSCTGEGCCASPVDEPESEKDISALDGQKCQMQENENKKLLPAGIILRHGESQVPSVKPCCATSATNLVSKNANELGKKLPQGGCTCEAAKAEGVVLRNCESLVSLGSSDEVQRQQIASGSREMTLQRPRSIYESEDIPLKRGIVQQTKHEIEMRERSSSSIDLSQGNASTSVHRSHSWRIEQSKSKDRNSKRRQTCHAVLVQSPSSADSLATSTPQQRTEVMECNTDNKDMLESDTTVHCVGLEKLEVAKGIVKRTTKGFEEGMPVALVISSCDEPSDQCFGSSSVQDEIPVEIGLVRRQTKHIETTYGSQSPSLSRRHLDTDLDTRELEESPACQTTVKPGSCSTKREATTTTSLAPISGRCPGDAFLSSGKAPVRRDEQRLHLSLSQKGVSPAVQSFESPDRPRPDLFSAPLDLTKKEMSTRKTSFLKEETKGIESMDAKHSQVPSKGMQPNQEFSSSSGILRRNLSQGNIRFNQLGCDGISVCAERNLGGFSRAYSFRETTSAVKLDDAALSRFSRSGSLRIERQKRLDEHLPINSPRPFTRPPLSSSNINFSQVVQPVSVKWPLSVSKNVALDGPVIYCATTDPASIAKSGKAGKDLSLAPENRVCVGPVIGYNKTTYPGSLPQLSKADSDIKVSLPTTNLPVEMRCKVKSAPESALQPSTPNSIPNAVGCKVDTVHKEDMLSEKPESFLNIVSTKCVKGVVADCKPSVEPDRAAAVASGTLLMKSFMMMQARDQKAKIPNETSLGDIGRPSRVIEPDAKINSMTPSPALHKASLPQTSEVFLSQAKNCVSEIVDSKPLSAVDLKTGLDVILCPESQQTQSRIDCNALSNEKLISNSCTADSISVISVQSSHSSKSSIRFSDSQANSGKSKGKTVNRPTALLDSKQPLTSEGSTAAETSVIMRTSDLEARKKDCLTPECSSASSQVVTECELIKPEKSLSTSVDLPEEKPSHNDGKMLHTKSAAAKTLAARRFGGSFSDTPQITNRPSATEEPFNHCTVSLPQDLVSNDQNTLPSSDSVHKQGELDHCRRELVKPQRDLEKNQRELDNCRRDSGKHGEDFEKQTNLQKDVQLMNSASDVKNSHANMMEEKDQNSEGAILLCQKKTFGPAKIFGCDKHATWSESVSSQPARSQSLHDETCLSTSQTTGLHGTKKLYGKSHPLSRLSTDLTVNNNWTPLS